MYMRPLLEAAIVVLGSVLAFSAASAPPADANLIPVSSTPPLMCTTKNFTVQAIIAGTTFPVPNTARCNGKPCSDYGYLISSMTSNADHILFAVSATQLVLPPPETPANVAVFGLGAGDNITGFLAFSQHEYAMRFNAAVTRGEAHVLIAGSSSPAGLTTVVIRSGAKQTESCLIAGPGAAATRDKFQPVFENQTSLVAGGKCIAHLSFDADGNISDITAQPADPNDKISECAVGSPETGVLMIGDKPLRNNTSPHGITFGDGTTTCYGPPIPSIPKCICTRKPCP